jgi:L-malate glycosyltransferase
MRVLYFSRDYTPHDHRFLSALAQTSHQVYYLRLERRGHALEDRVLPVQIDQLAWEGGCRPFNWRDGYKLLHSLRHVIRSIRPEVIHAGPIQTAALLTALTGFKRLVSMSWGYDLLHDANRNWLRRRATEFTLHHSAVLLGDCEAVQRQAIKWGMNHERIIIFPWGVDLNHFNPGKSSPPVEDSFNLLSTRSWEPIYGVDVLAQAFVLAARQRPNIRLMMAGHGSLASRLFQIFERGEVTSRVIFPGQIGYMELPGFYRSADLYLSASHSDGSSISLLEALACGTPVLVSDIPGNREWVEEGVQGWFFPDGDVEALASAILRIVDQRMVLTEMGSAARTRAEERADWQKNFPKLLDAYELALRQ